MLDTLAVPIVQAPMAGGPSTPELAAAVAGAGGLGFIAAGYLTAEGLREPSPARATLTDRAVRRQPVRPDRRARGSGGGRAPTPSPAPDADRAGVALGEPRFDDDAFDAKLDLLRSDPVAVVSFTFGCPPPETFARVRATGADVWVTVTDPDEARAGGRRRRGRARGPGRGGGRAPRRVRRPRGPRRLRAARAAPARPGARRRPPRRGRRHRHRPRRRGRARGGRGGRPGRHRVHALPRGRDVRAAPRRARVGAPDRPDARLLRPPRARDRQPPPGRAHRDRAARVPEIHHVTAPLRAAARKAGDADVINLWAGEAHELAAEAPAAEVVARLMDEARAALAAANERLGAAR